jgi:hypothetical protein
MVRWRKLDKINLHKIYNIYFFNGHKASYLWFMKQYQIKEKWENNIILSYKISSNFFLKVMVFSKNKSLLCIYCLRSAKNKFFEWIFNQKF